MADREDAGKTGERSVAVALAYDHEAGAAPQVVAKGRGAVAERIIENARAHGVHVEENPVLAEALSAVELDDTIPRDLYRAVAEVIGFVLRHSPAAKHHREQ
ncbi:MAG: EscU/YscU/HrcU family type III secretion system export apparatus switch protein [Rhodobiaceae bacterium]|nr:EscU/YscU/HrcU family type III secretion system export apparatus switch protein [Rhodobiaceae bacterium]